MIQKCNKYNQIVYCFFLQFKRKGIICISLRIANKDHTDPQNKTVQRIDIILSKVQNIRNV